MQSSSEFACDVAIEAEAACVYDALVDVAENGNSGRASPVHHEGSIKRPSAARLGEANRMAQPSDAVLAKDPAWRPATESPANAGLSSLAACRGRDEILERRVPEWVVPPMANDRPGAILQPLGVADPTRREMPGTKTNAVRGLLETAHGSLDTRDPRDRREPYDIARGREPLRRRIRQVPR